MVALRVSGPVRGPEESKWSSSAKAGGGRGDVIITMHHIVARVRAAGIYTEHRSHYTVLIKKHNKTLDRLLHARTEHTVEPVPGHY